MGSCSPLASWRILFSHALSQGNLVLFLLGRCPVALVGTSSAGLGKLGKGHCLHGTWASLLQAWAPSVTQFSKPWKHASPHPSLAPGVFRVPGARSGNLSRLSHLKSLRTSGWKPCSFLSISSLPISCFNMTDIPAPSSPRGMLHLTSLLFLFCCGWRKPLSLGDSVT